MLQPLAERVPAGRRMVLVCYMVAMLDKDVPQWPAVSQALTDASWSPTSADCPVNWWAMEWWYTRCNRVTMRLIDKHTEPDAATPASERQRQA